MKTEIWILISIFLVIAVFSFWFWKIEKQIESKDKQILALLSSVIPNNNTVMK